MIYILELLRWTLSGFTSKLLRYYYGTNKYAIYYHRFGKDLMGKIIEQLQSIGLTCDSHCVTP